MTLLICQAVRRQIIELLSGGAGESSCSTCHAVAVEPAAAARYALDIADDTFVVAPRAAVAELVRDRASWRVWWPDLELTVTSDRGLKGVRWSVRGAGVGSMEIWLEPWGDGVVVHWYLRAVPARAVRHPDRERARRVRAWKERVNAVKAALECGREPGSPCTGSGVGGFKDRGEHAESQ